MAAQTPNGQPAGSDPGVYTNGIPQTYPGREYQLRRSVPPLRNARPIDAGLYYFAFAMRTEQPRPRHVPHYLDSFSPSGKKSFPFSFSSLFHVDAAANVVYANVKYRTLVARILNTRVHILSTINSNY